MLKKKSMAVCRIFDYEAYDAGNGKVYIVVRPHGK